MIGSVMKTLKRSSEALETLSGKVLKWGCGMFQIWVSAWIPPKEKKKLPIKGKQKWGGDWMHVSWWYYDILEDDKVGFGKMESMLKKIILPCQACCTYRATRSLA